MFKKLLAFSIIFLLIGMNVVSSTGDLFVNKSSIPLGGGDILYVGGNGTGNYSNIQDAIDDANEGDTVFVYDESSPYYTNIVVDKSINLRGESRDTTKIYGDWEDFSVIYVSADWVNISGFTIVYEYGEELCGIKLDSCNNNISGNIFTDNWYDILLLESSNDNIIVDNIFKSEYSLNGIYLSNYNDNNIIKNNAFSYKWFPIYLSNSCFNIIMDNYFLKNTHGIILEDFCMNNTIAGNELYNISCCTCIGIGSSSNNNILVCNQINMCSYWGVGIAIFDSKNNVVIGNYITKCGYGVRLSDSTDNKILCNNVVNCEEYGVKLSDSLLSDSKEFDIHLRDSKCSYINSKYNINIGKNIHHNTNYNGNTIHHNNFLFSDKHAYDECSNKWDNGYPSGGNFWDDYNGTDNDGDGIGDTPYPIPGGDNEDRYPLMEPWEDNLLPIAEFTWTPSHPDPEESIFFNASESIDYDGYITLFEWDWDNDGVYDESHTNPTAAHTFDEKGYYPVTLLIHDNELEIDTITKTVRVGNYPPEPPIITGPKYGKVGVEYHYNFSLFDIDNNSMYLRVDWGNGTPGPWLGPFASDTSVILNHTWNQQGTFTIRAQAKDIYDAESEWGTLDVTMPKNKIFYDSLYLKYLNKFPLLQRLLDTMWRYL